MSVFENFTNIPDIDTEILHYLNSKNLYDVCIVNKYASRLCYRDKTLRHRINIYKKIFNEYQLLLSGVNPMTGRRIRIGGPIYQELEYLYIEKLKAFDL